MANLLSNNCIIHNPWGIRNYILSTPSITYDKEFLRLYVPDKINLKGAKKSLHSSVESSAET